MFAMWYHRMDQGLEESIETEEAPRFGRVTSCSRTTADVAGELESQVVEGT